MAIRTFQIEVDDEECPWLNDYVPVAFRISHDEVCVDSANDVKTFRSRSPRMILEPIKRDKKLVPFTFSEWSHFVGKPVISKDRTHTKLVTAVSLSIDGQTSIRLCFSGYSVQDMLDGYTFPDGSPCGKYAEEPC